MGWINLAFRGGKLYIIDDTFFPLAYLPDKVTDTGIPYSVWYAYNRCNPLLTTCNELIRDGSTGSYYSGDQSQYPFYLNFASYKFFDIKDE